jgi:hypothetical protein
VDEVQRRQSAPELQHRVDRQSAPHSSEGADRNRTPAAHEVQHGHR